MEINHYFSPYIAEMANSFSNLFSIGISLCGFYETRVRGRELPLRYGIGYLVCATVILVLEKFLSERVLCPGYRTRGPRQFLLPCYSLVRSTARRRTSHDIRQLGQSVPPIRQSTGFWAQKWALGDTVGSRRVIRRAIFLELVCLVHLSQKEEPRR